MPSATVVVDVFIEPGTVVELQGCFWLKCKCIMPKAGWSAAELAVQARDQARFAFLKSQGYKVVVIWECELANDPERVRKLLRGLKA
jgi:G:T-mismatch repair DNA endonuclease (very short patch repair protein)